MIPNSIAHFYNFSEYLPSQPNELQSFLLLFAAPCAALDVAVTPLEILSSKKNVNSTQTI